MKTISLALFAAALGIAQSTTPAPAPKPAPKAAPAAQNKKAAQPAKPSTDAKAKAPSPGQTIPAGATLVESNLYRYTDSNGKTWNYRQTPFGISKWEETATPAAQASPQAKAEPALVTDLGDSYRFERKTPFGTSTWVHKKSELTDEEKALAGVRQAPSEPDSSSIANKPAGNR
jgi:hypothetical protein